MSKTTYIVAENKKIILDEKDKSIIKALLRNARLSISQISEITLILRDTVAKRILKLKKNNVILGYDITLDPVTLGYNYFAHIFIKLETLPREELSDFYQKMKDTPQITHITKILGNYDIVLTIVARDGRDFDEVVENLKRNPKKIIEKMDICTITEEPKINDFSGLIS